jgi:mono/diheme cytochrome c family protein
MKANRWLLALIGGVLLGAAVVGAAHPASADDAAPLKKWMQANMGANKDDAKALVPAFTKVASFQPDPAWTEWKTMSAKGAQLAAAGKLEGKDGASQVCKDCHGKYKDEYKAKYRARPLP